MTARQVLIGLAGGVLLGFMDGLIHGNPYARDLFQVYEPIARSSVNVPAGIVIDLLYGFLLAVVFLTLQPSLPGQSGLAKGLSYGGLLFFLRVFMSVAGSWMMFEIPVATLLYSGAAGFLEMMLLGAFYGLALSPRETG